MVVDDNEDIAFTFKTALEKKGFLVDSFSSPEDAISNLVPDKYDLLTIDINMPRMNGFQFYRNAKKIDDKPKVCFVTSFDIRKEEFEKVFPNLNVSCIIRKPVDKERFVEIIDSELVLDMIDRK